MKKVLISACLMGENVRYDGKNSRKSSATIEQWRQSGYLVSFCPEVSGGLSIPRPPAELQPDSRVITVEGDDVTTEFKQGAERALALCREHRIQIAILKEGSPSCGNSLINDGTFSHTKVSGQGVTTQLLEKNGIRVFSEDDIEKAEKHLKAIK